MAYWVTTHWPRRIDEPLDRPHEGVWVTDENKNVIERLENSDLVFIYEARSGPDEIVEYADGTSKTRPCRPGEGCVVALVEVLERASERAGSKPQTFSDGKTRWWRYHA